MTVGDLKTEKGVKDLDSYLGDKSYIEGYQASQVDVAVFECLTKAPSSNTPHALRWYNHIKSFNADSKKKLPGQKKLPSGFGSSGGAPAPAVADDDVDLFGSDEEEDEEVAKIKEQRLKEYAAKKSKKPALIAKSSIVLDVKPWDDETDMKLMEEKVRSLVKEGLVWGASKLVPVGYGILKLQIMCIVEDDKVSIDELTDQIQEFEDYVQSVDIAAFNKI